VIHDHEALLLASAALDFELEPAAAAELQLALAECPVCAERAAAYKEQNRLLARLPVIDVSESTRRRVTAAAVRGRSDTRQPLLLLAAALLIGLILSVAAIAGGLLKDSRPTDLGLGDETPPPASTSPAPVAAQGSRSPVDPGAGGGSSAPFSPDAIVEVVSGNLRVRSEPRVTTDSKMLEPLLQPGDRLFVIEGPVTANDYDWYHVIPIGANPDRSEFALPSGWVARGDHDGSPWVAASAPRCPAAPVEIAALRVMHPLEAVACFGDQKLSLRAVVQGFGPVTSCDDSSGFDTPCPSGPEWLAGVAGWSAVVGDDFDGVDVPSFAHRLTIDPSGTVRPADLPDGRVVVLEGAFDNARATDCRAGEATANQVATTDAEAVLHCRSWFVVSRAVLEPHYLEPGTAAAVATDNLRVRSLPNVSDDSSKLTPLLDAGTRLWVVRGPAVGSGFDWYKVLVPSVSNANGGMLGGWVAVASKTGETWVRPDEIDCPPPDDVTLDDMRALASRPFLHGGLACFGRGSPLDGGTVAFDAHARLECHNPAASFVPDWMTAGDRILVLELNGQEFRAIPHGFTILQLACDDAYDSRLYRVFGHFDDPDAETCEPIGGSDGSTGDFDWEIATYQCRSQFVVSYLDSGPLSPP
jgi:hypothetical protein